MNSNTGNNFIFFGSPKFAEIILNNLIKSDFKPHLIVCSPDRPLGRKQIITPPPVKILAEKNSIKIYQPEKLDIKNWQSEISENFDFAIVAAYSKIIPKEILKLFPLGIIGVHPSLLPKYRGASPIQSAILSGEEESGAAGLRGHGDIQVRHGSLEHHHASYRPDLFRQHDMDGDHGHGLGAGHDAEQHARRRRHR